MRAVMIKFVAIFSFVFFYAFFQAYTHASSEPFEQVNSHKKKSSITSESTSAKLGLVKIHAVHKESFSCSEHWAGQFDYPGDALGTDCVIDGWYEDETRLFQRTYRTNGFSNEDWFGFRKNVLAPCDCIVDSIHINKMSNKPGVMTPGQASSVTFKTAEGDFILYAHVRELSVSKGDHVKAGQSFAKVGNNGYSRNPHIHIGAWSKDAKPLQIRFDQKTIGLAFREQNQNK